MARIADHVIRDGAWARRTWLNVGCPVSIDRRRGLQSGGPGRSIEAKVLHAADRHLVTGPDDVMRVELLLRDCQLVDLEVRASRRGLTLSLASSSELASGGGFGSLIVGR